VPTHLTIRPYRPEDDLTALVDIFGVITLGLNTTAA